MICPFAARHAPRVALIPAACVLLASGWFCRSIYPFPNPQTELLLPPSNAPQLLEGEVVRLGPVRQIESAAPFSSQTRNEVSRSVDLHVHSLANRAVTGGVRLTIYSPAERPLPNIQCGQLLSVVSAVHAPERYNDPGVWDSSAYLLEQGIGALASAKSVALTVRNTPTEPSLTCRIRSFQQAASDRIIRFTQQQPTRLPRFLRLSPDDAALLAAMITGDRTWLGHRLRAGFERTGSFHLLVVSGLHLAIFAGIIFWLSRRLRLPRIPAALLTITAAFAYAVFTGFGQPVQRSFWMITLFLLGRLLWRERRPLNAIGFAALCLLAANPLALFDPGFQMTLLSVLAVSGIAVPVAERTFSPHLRATRNLRLIAIDPSLPPTIAQFRVSLRLLGQHLRPLTGKTIAMNGPAFCIRLALRCLELLLVSLVIELIMSLPMAIYFHRITVFALPVNVLIMPLVALLLPAALLTCTALLVSPYLAVAPAAITAGLLHLVARVVHLFGSLPSSEFRVPTPHLASITAYIVLLASALWLVRRGRFAVPMAGAALILAAACALAPVPVSHRKDALEVTAIDVGQGDSLLVITPDGKALLIDVGGSPFGPPPGTSNFDIGEDVVSSVLWSRGIRRLDAVALTHAHADHIGGMPAVLTNFRPREVWVGNNPPTREYEAFLARAREVGAELRHFAAGDTFAFGSTEVRVLAPTADYRPGPVATNNDSLVLRIAYKQTSALLEGDAEAPGEASMVAAGHLHSDLLKVGHHGSRTSTTPDFLSAVSPTFAVISVGRHNLYGHPRIEVLQELESSRVRTYRTDCLGESTFFLDGTHVTGTVQR